MNILITNDDSISCESLLPLVTWAMRFGEVTTIVPQYEQSGKSHSIELHKAFTVMKTELAPEISAYTVDSTPADCVRYGVLGLRKKFDLVLSGINRGFNVGPDIRYSGTVGAVFEAAYRGIPAIALSTDPSSFAPALKQLDAVHDYFVRHSLFQKHGWYNVNLPLENKGFRITRQGDAFFSDTFVFEAGNLVRSVGKRIDSDSGNIDLDTDAVLHGYISILPLSLAQTDEAAYQTLVALND